MTLHVSTSLRLSPHLYFRPTVVLANDTPTGTSLSAMGTLDVAGVSTSWTSTTRGPPYQDGPQPLAFALRYVLPKGTHLSLCAVFPSCLLLVLPEGY